MSIVLISYDGLRTKGITLSRTQLWRNERAGKFPKRVNVTEGRVAWVEREIDSWIAARVAARDVSA
jgi:prophage regulatory protein